MKPAEYAKAIVGAVVAGLTALAAAMDSSGVSAAEWVGVAVTTLATFGTVFATPNADPLGEPRRRRHSVGAVDPLYALVCLAVAALVVWLFVQLVH